jgi:ABC-2 type transport system permease protein
VFVVSDCHRIYPSLLDDCAAQSDCVRRLKLGNKKSEVRWNGEVKRVLQRYAKLYWVFVKLRFKIWMEYRIDFFIGILSVLFIQGSTILFVSMLFGQIGDLDGWGYYEVLFVFGVAICGRSIHHIFFDNLWVFGWGYIRSGEFDRLLIRPINPLFHLIADRVQQDGIGQLIVGIIVLNMAAGEIGVIWDVGNVLLLLLMIVASGAIFVSLNLIMATLSFWMVDSLPIMWAVHNFSDFARYPMGIYNQFVRGLLTWLIPYGFTAFYPATLFLDRGEWRLFALSTPFVALVLCGLAYAFWLRGLRAFSSTGS